jgi:hypothetical protein
MDQKPDIRPETLKLLKKNMGGLLQDVGIGRASE